MSYIACVAGIRKTLSGLESVNEVPVSLEDKNAVVKYDTQKITLENIEKTINEMGYKRGSIKRN